MALVAWVGRGWQRLRMRIYRLRALLWPDVVLLEGQAEGGRSLSILRAGISDRQTAYYFAGQILTNLRSERALGRAWIWRLPALARQHGCAFVLFHIQTPHLALARGMLRRADLEVLHLPVFVEAIVDVSSLQNLLRKHSLQQDVRKIVKSGFQSSVSRSKEDLETFIEHYHDPYVRRVHGFDAIEMNFQPVLASCSGNRLPDSWLLLKVELDGEWVAGVLLACRAKKPALMELGVRNGDMTLVKRGALQAAYWLSLQYLSSQGHGQVSLMHSRPFLANGVLKYKLKFNPSLTASRTTQGFLLFFDRKNGLAREVLIRQPLLAFDGDLLRAVLHYADSVPSQDVPGIRPDILAIAGVTGIQEVVLRS